MLSKTTKPAALVPISAACEKIGQTELVRMVQLEGIPLTRETLVKIERGIQHVKISQLRAIRTVLKVSYDDLLDGGG